MRTRLTLEFRGRDNDAHYLVRTLFTANVVAILADSLFVANLGPPILRIILLALISLAWTTGFYYIYYKLMLARVLALPISKKTGEDKPDRVTLRGWLRGERIHDVAVTLISTNVFVAVLGGAALDARYAFPVRLASLTAGALIYCIPFYTFYRILGRRYG